MVDSYQSPGHGGDATNQFDGEAENAFQIRDVDGGIHFHGAAEKRIEELTAELRATRQALTQANQELRQLRNYQSATVAFARVRKPAFQAGMHGYHVLAVKELMDKIKSTLNDGPSAILELLSFHNMMNENGLDNRFFDAREVDTYLDSIRSEMINAIQACGQVWSD